MNCVVCIASLDNPCLHICILYISLHFNLCQQQQGECVAAKCESVCAPQLSAKENTLVFICSLSSLCLFSSEN